MRTMRMPRLGRGSACLWAFAYKHRGRQFVVLAAGGMHNASNGRRLHPEQTMDKSNPPKSFGVFKPVGHTVIAFANLAEADAVYGALIKQGMASTEIVRYTPDEMKAQVDVDLFTASPLASVGQDLNLVKAHRGLAEEGCHFLVVHTADDAQADKVANAARSGHARVAQRYGRFIIEEVIASAEGERQVFESPDRGLDINSPAAHP